MARKGKPSATRAKPRATEVVGPVPYDVQLPAGTAAIHRGDDSITEVAARNDTGETRARRDARAAAIDEFLEKFAKHPERELLADMITTVCRLAGDGASRLDLRILAGAMKELRYGYKVFAPYADRRKITIFGSARTPTSNACYKSTVEFAKKISEKGWMVITGAGDGIMRAGHEGAGKDLSFGVSIRLPFETNANDFIDGDPKLVNFRYFFTRKLMFLKEAEAVALFPGGFGTHDELFETLTLVQTGKSQPMPIVLVDEPGGHYWTKWQRYAAEELVLERLINPEDMNLFKVTSDVDEAVEEVVNFYRRYSSSRYVGGQLVIRMVSPLPAGRLVKLNEDFADICKGGKIVAVDSPLPQEEGEEPDAHRLVVPFNRRHYGRLRLLIDAINED